MRYFSMFTGIGGFELGIHNAHTKQQYISSESEQEERPQGRERVTDELLLQLRTTDGTAPLCVGYSEIDKHAIATYESRFGKDTKNYGDATTIDTRDLPDFDLLVGGFPCQAFSVAGKRRGFEDTRGTLFFDVARILRDKRPRHFVLENVKGLLSHDNGKTFQTILEILSDTGYDVSWSIHNSKNYGVPQNRERIYIIGNLRGEPRPQVFPVTIDDSKDTGVGGVMPKITIPVLTPDRIVKRQNGRRFKTDGEPSFTLNTQDRHGVYDGVLIRRLTPMECERLQGFPDGWTIGSDTQRYKQCGNAITVNVVEHVIRSLYEDTNKSSSRK